MSTSVGKNSVYSLLKSFCQVIFPLITFPYITRTLMASNVGKINFSNSIVIYVSLIASLGITTYAIRECSKVRGEGEKLEKIASEIFSINIITTILSYIILLLFLMFAKPLYNYRLLIGLLSASILFTTLGADWLNSAMEDFKFITIRTFIFQLLSLVLMFAFVRSPSDYYKYALINVFSSSGANIVNIFYRKKYCNISFTLDIDWKKHLKPIIILFAMILFQTIFCNSDITILGLIKGDFEVGLYSTSVKIYNIVNTMIASIAWVVMPKMSYNFAINNYKEINRLFRYSASFIVLLGLPAIVGINVLCTDVVLIIAGKEFLGATTSLHILTISLALSLVTGLIGNIILLPSNKEKLFLKGCIYAAIANVVLNLIFIPMFGLNAAALTTTVSQLITLIVIVVKLDDRIRLVNVKKILLGPAIGSVLIFLICLLLKYTVDELYMRLILSVIFSAIVYVFALVITKNDFAVKIFSYLLKK